MKRRNRLLKSKSVSFDEKDNTQSMGGNHQVGTNLETLSKDCTYMNYLSDNSFLLFPGKTQWRERLRYTMLVWGEMPHALEIEQFCTEWRIPRRTLYAWRSAYPDIKETIEDVKLMLASRRRVGSMNNKLNGTWAYRNLHQYDPEHEAVDKYHNDLKKDVAVSAATNANLVADNWKKIMEEGNDK